MTKKNAVEGEVLDQPRNKYEVAVTEYLRSKKVVNFSEFSFEQRLSTFTKKTPRNWIKDLTVGNKKVKYVPHKYSRMVLNLIFNFNISNEIMKEEYITYKAKYKEYKDGRWTGKWEEKNVTEAEVTVKFTCKLPNGDYIFRTVKGSHKAVENRAVNRGHCMSSAISKTWTLLANTFGIFLDLEKDPDVHEKEDAEEKPQATKKNFHQEDEIDY